MNNDVIIFAIPMHGYFGFSRSMGEILDIDIKIRNINFAEYARECTAEVHHVSIF